jgi:hypothetical protein
METSYILRKSARSLELVYGMTNHHPDYLGHNEYITDKSGCPYQYFHCIAFGEVLVERDSNFVK